MKAALLVLAVAVAALAGATHASALQSTCTPGGTGATHTFCGPARATLKFGGHTYHFNRGGNCTTDSSTWALNLGTITLSGKPQSAYLGVTMFSKRPGTHDAAISWQLRGRNHSLAHGKVTIARGLKTGTFTGVLRPGDRAHGSFTCR